MTDQTNEAAGGTAENKPKMEFSLERIYLKDLSFEAPQGAKAFLKQWKPKVNQELTTQTTKVDDDHYEVVLNVTITVKSEEETLYLVEIQQAGIFTAKGFDTKQLAAVLNTQCPHILFPYARETVDSLVTKGSFPALMLPPINFDALFMQAVANAKAQAEAKASETVN
jgi:preprotein translocase subunit SecB